MQPAQPQPPALSLSPNRPPGSFSPLLGASSPSLSPRQQRQHQHQLQHQLLHQQPAASPRPRPLRIDSLPGDDGSATPAIAVTKPSSASSASSASASRRREGSPATPVYKHFLTAHASATSASSASLHHALARSPAAPQLATPSGLTSPLLAGHARKLSATQGFFDSTLPSMATPGLSGTSQPPNQAAVAAAAAAASSGSLSASHMAAKAVVMSHQNASHVRQRSQTVPFPGEANEGSRRGSGSKMPLSPPLLSLTEASAPRDSVFGITVQSDRLAGPPSSAATAAANVVFPRSGHSSPRDKSISPQPVPPLPPMPPTLPDKPSAKAEKSKVKLFSRPDKIGTSKGDAKDKALPSPGKIGTALSALQRANFSTSSLVDAPTQSLYSLTNSSSATIRPIDSFGEDRVKEKEKKHHFLSRQKQKLKDEYHLPLSSAASNSKPTDPSAPSSLYNFHVPASPGPGSASFVKAKKDKKLAERAENRLDGESTFSLQGDWPGCGSMPSLSQQSTLYDPIDPAKLGLQNHVSLDDAWPYLKAKLLVIFEGEDLRLPVEDFNRVVQMHIQWCIHRRSPGSMLEDLRELLATGFSSLDRTLRLTPEDLFVPTLVELWLFTFTSILPYMQSVFLPLDLEVSGCGVIMSAEQAHDFWSGVAAPPPAGAAAAATAAATAAAATAAAAAAAEKAVRAASVLDMRRLVLTAFRDIVILPRYETLKSMFSRLSLEFLPSSFANVALASPSESFSSMVRPGTAMSLDPSVGSYNSTGTTLLGDGSERGRSRVVSNVSFGSHGSEGAAGLRPLTPSGVQVLSSVREQNVEDSKQLTDMVGRMLQCMSVLAGLGGVGGDADADDADVKMVELCKMLKLNWLGRGRTSRNRRGIVGGRVRRDGVRDEVRVA